MIAIHSSIMKDAVKKKKNTIRSCVNITFGLKGGSSLFTSTHKITSGEGGLKLPRLCERNTYTADVSNTIE